MNMPHQHHHRDVFEKITHWMGSPTSVVMHTFAFFAFFLAGVFEVAEWEILLLVLTTLVSLEAIYLSLFIQMTVNRHTHSLREVEKDVDEIQEDIEEISEDVEEIHENVEELQEGVAEVEKSA